MADASWMPYILTDRVASPPLAARYHSEKFVYLPYTYFVTDQRQSEAYVIEQGRLSARNRSQYGLPDDAFLFASFTQLYKVRRLHGV